jgi:hydroxymethylpyrimidine pyrophosphatase-like HAD family hydrolase
MDKKNKKREVWAVDFDGTLVEYQTGDMEKYGPDHIGAPITEMVNKVKAALDQGIEVFIFTARVNPFTDEFDDQLQAAESYGQILDWCEQNLGQRLPVTHEKLRCFHKIIDDRAEQVIPNTGVFLSELVEASNASQ